LNPDGGGTRLRGELERQPEPIGADDARSPARGYHLRIEPVTPV